MIDSNCRQCGKINPPSNGNRARKYCSKKCANDYHHKKNSTRREGWGDKSREVKRHKEDRRREYEETVKAGWANYRDIAKEIGLTHDTVHVRIRELLEEGVETKKIHNGAAGKNGWKRYVHPDAIEKIVNYQPKGLRGADIEGLMRTRDAIVYCGYKGRATFLRVFKKLGFKADKKASSHGCFFSKETIDAFLKERTKIEEERSEVRRLASLERQRLKEQKEHERNKARKARGIARGIRELEKQRIRTEKNKAKEEARLEQLEEVKRILKQQEKDAQARKDSAMVAVPYIPKENTVEIPLWLNREELSDKVAIIDEEDYDKVMGAISEISKWYYWTAKAPSTQAYAMSGDRRKSVHRVVANPSKGEWVDHINGNGLDNRKENLRACTPQQNSQYRKLRADSSTGYKGVAYTPIQKEKYTSKKTGITTIRENVLKKPYRAYIGDPERMGRHIALGWYATKEEAARARDAKAKELHGEFAYLNFPDE